MRSHKSRRQFLRSASALAGSALFLPHARVLQAQPAQLERVRLADGMIAVIGPDATVLAADSDDGIIMVDGGHASWSDTLQSVIADHFDSKPVGALFNTHWHTEQTGSNLTWGEQGVEIIAHENTKLWLGTDVWVRWSDKKYPPLPRAAQPTTTFYDSASFQLGGRRVESGHLLNAHTDGDIWVFFPEENVLATGGVVSNDGWPIIDWWTGGWIVGMLDGFDTLLEIANEETRIVPGNGPIMSLAELKTQHEMYSIIWDRLQGMIIRALGTDEVLAARPTAEYDEEWGDPELFVTLAFQSLWGHLRDAHDKRFRSGA
jgi:cyclase